VRSLHNRRRAIGDRDRDRGHRPVRVERAWRGAAWNAWPANAETGAIHEIGQVAVKIQQDKDAVEAGCTLTGPNGQTEDQVSRLKLLKRQAYGRAKFDRLRQQTLDAA